MTDRNLTNSEEDQLVEDAAIEADIEAQEMEENFSPENDFGENSSPENNFEEEEKIAIEKVNKQRDIETNEMANELTKLCDGKDLTVFLAAVGTVLQAVIWQNEKSRHFINIRLGALNNYLAKTQAADLDPVQTC